MDRDKAQRVAGSSATVADKIRALDAAGYPRADIARLLGKRYQHVRNVLEGDRLRKPEPPGAESRGVAEAGSPFQGAYAIPDFDDRGGGAFRLSVREDGSVVLPPAVREAFGLAGPGNVMARMEGEEFKIIGVGTAMRRIHELLEPHRRAEGALASDELIAERRAGELWGD